MMNILDIRKELYLKAEISGEEANTNSTIVDLLKMFYPDKIINNLNNSYSLACIFRGKEGGSTVCFRADIDALPIEDKLDNSGSKRSISHKCGHDGHTATLLAFAEKLKDRNFKGTAVLLFQAEEETGQGAAKVMADKRFLDLNIDMFYAFHNLPGFPENALVVRDGTFASASKGMIIELQGQTSHASEPELGNSPALALTALIHNMIALPQRNTNFHQSNLVTIIYASLGEKAFGTSPGFAELRATLRSSSEIDMNAMCKDAEQLAFGISKTYDLKCKISYEEEFPATVNHKMANNSIRIAAEKLNLRLIEKDTPFPWSEDFGHYLQYKPGAYFGIGAGLNAKNLHHPEYEFNDQIIKTGVEVFFELLQLESSNY